MITSFVKASESDPLTTLEEVVKDSWVYVEKPTEEELVMLSEDLHIDIHILHDAIDLQEVPRLEVEDESTFIFTKFVYTDHNEQIQTAPLLIILKQNYFVTVSAVELPYLSVFTHEKVQFTTTNKTKLLVLLFDKCNDTFNEHINIISKQVRKLSINIEKVKNRDIVRFVNYENRLYDIESALVRINAIFTQLLNGKKIEFNKLELAWLSDLNLDNDQFIQITRETLRSITNIREAYSTIMTNNLNRVIKLFTSLTVILTIPTIIGTFYGMNVTLPFQHSPDAFLTIVVSTMIASLIVLAIFLFKDWL